MEVNGGNMEANRGELRLTWVETLLVPVLMLVSLLLRGFGAAGAGAGAFCFVRWGWDGGVDSPGVVLDGGVLWLFMAVQECDHLPSPLERRQCSMNGSVAVAWTASSP